MIADTDGEISCTISECPIGAYIGNDTYNGALGMIQRNVRVNSLTFPYF